MYCPLYLTVAIEGYDEEFKARRTKISPWYKATEYQIDDGTRFWVAWDYLDECDKEKKAPFIQLQVIAKNEKTKQKIEYGQQQLAKQAKEQQTGLVLPDGYKV